MFCLCCKMESFNIACASFAHITYEFPINLFGCDKPATLGVLSLSIRLNVFHRHSGLCRLFISIGQLLTVTTGKFRETGIIDITRHCVADTKLTILDEMRAEVVRYSDDFPMSVEFAFSGQRGSSKWPGC